MEQAAARLRFAIAEARTHELVQRVIAGVERAILGLVPETYDTTPAITVARSLGQAINEKDSARVAEAEDHFANEVLLWRISLCSRDDAIKPYDLRRFCERTEEDLDATVFTALTRFYRSRSYSDLSQSKYDFAVTHLYANVDENDRRALRFEGEALVENIRQTFATWEQEPGPITANEDDIGAALDGFRQFIVTAGEIHEFEELIASGLFNRVRIFKSKLGEKFYLPEVTAAGIESNVAIANKFSDLLGREGAQIREAPAAYRNLTNILSDTSAIGFVSGALNELQMAELDQQAQSSAQLAQLMRLLRVSNDDHEESSQEPGDENEESPSPTPMEKRWVPAELSLTLCTLAEDEENKEIISEFLRTPLSEERQSLDPAIFLARLPEVEPGEREEERQARRGALALILRSERERLVFSKLALDDPITAETETELAALLEEMQQTDSTLRRLIAEARASSQLPLVDQLLHISNHLLGARLSLQSALVERGAEELARQEELAREKAEAARAPKKAGINWWGIGRYAAAAVVLIVCAVLTMRALTLKSTAHEQRDKEVKILDVKDMPGSEVLVGARLKQKIMVVIVSPAWVRWPDEQKRDELKALLQYGEPLGVDTVMLVDSGGAQRGSVSDSHLTLDSDPTRKPEK
jgi:hypothetical protein